MLNVFKCLALTGVFSLLALHRVEACTSSIVQPGMSITSPPIVVQPGKGCRISFNLEGWEIHRIALVERPTRGAVSIDGSRSYTYVAGKTAGQDRFVIEIETTGYDWQSGAKLQRASWRITRPVEIR